MTVDESLAAFAPVLARAAELGWWRRGYVSTAFGCPYTGRVEPARAVEVALRLLELGVDEVCFGDTIGVGVPAPGRRADRAGRGGRASRSSGIAFHFHDTRGTALANVAAGLDAGVRCFDSSTGGTGGCPYAPGAAGNLATEDLVYLLDASGWDLGRVARRRPDRRPLHRRRARPAARARKVGQAGGWDPATGSRDRPRLIATDASGAQPRHVPGNLLSSRPMDGVVLVLNQNYEPLNVCNLPRPSASCSGRRPKSSSTTTR